MIIITENRVYGIYSSIEVRNDHLFCDGKIVLPLSVIGEYIISEDDSLLPVPQHQKEPVPTFVYPRQIRLALTRSGLRSAVENYVANSNQDLKDWWEFSNEFYRDNPFVQQTATTLGVSSEQLDDLWRLARSL